MEKRKERHGISRILALTLSFLMIFTGLGIGQWGLEDAYAAEEQTLTEAELTENAKVGSYDGYDLYFLTVSESVDKLYFRIFDQNNLYVTPYFNASTDYYDDAETEPSTGYQFLTKNSANYNVAKTDYENANGDFNYTSTPVFDSTADHLLFLLYGYSDIYGYVILEWPVGIQVDTSQLSELLNSNPSTEKNDDTFVDTDFYHADDRYNGKTAIADLVDELRNDATIKADSDTLAVFYRYNSWTHEETRVESFWALYEAAMSRVNIIYPQGEGGTRTLADGVTQKQVDAAAKLLKSAIDSLIPTTQVNATALYEAVEANKAKKDKESIYTAASWGPFESALNEAQTMLDALYDEDGNATAVNRGPAAEGEDPEGAVHQSDVDNAAAALTAAAQNLYVSSAEASNAEKAESIAKYLPDLIEIAKSAKEEDYTAESWSIFTAAQEAAEAAEKPESDGLKQHADAVASYVTVFSNLNDAYYKKLVTKDSVTVNFIASNTSGARSGAGKAYGVSEEVSLPAGSKLSDLLSRYGMSHTVWSLVLVNDRFVSGNYTNTVYGTTPYAGNIVLHPGDEIAFAGDIQPWSTQSPTIVNTQAYLKQYLSSIKQSRFTQENGMTAEAGKAFTLNAEQLSAALGEENREWKAAPGMTIFVSQPQDEQGGKADTSVLKADGEKVITGADGSASITLFEEGWYLIQAYDLAADVMGDVPNTADTPMTEGTYHSTSSGASVWVHVGASSDADGVKASLKSILDETYKAYPESFFRPENWNTLNEAYQTGVKGISESASVGEAYNAQQTALAAIRKIQNDTIAENEKNLADFHKNLEKLPDDTARITRSVESVVEALIAVYDGMSDYQKTLLTGAEIKKYEAIADAYAKGLPEAKAYKLTLNVEGDTPESTAALNNMISWLRNNTKEQDTNAGGTFGGGLLEKAFSFQVFYSRLNHPCDITEAQPLDEIRLPIDVDYAAYYHVRDDEDHSISGEGWSISDGEDGLYFSEKSYLNYIVNGDLTVKINGTEYEVKSVTVDGLNDSEAEDGEYTTLDYSTYKGKDADWVNMHFSGAYKTFSMPYNDVTVTVKWGPAALDEARTSAIGALQAAYNAYDKNLYDDSGKAALQEALNQGINSIGEAETENAIAEARKAALAAMAAVPVSSPQQGDISYNSGKTVGKVYVSVENNTYPGGDFTGTILSGWYDLGENDTMMTCILKALQSAGFTWNGTVSMGGADAADYSITYLASIQKGDKSLAEFSGGQKSGWMGTLNDWFTSEGFNAFSVANGKLENGDEIHVMYTCDYGVDLGGDWNSADTSLKNLSVTGGTLSPSFSSSQTEYTLLISGETASVKLTPEAANKNYQARIFLNRYNADSAMYKRTDLISVKSGDVLYVGVGEAGWPTMNASGSGTRYTIKVVSGSDASAVTDLINSIRAITYGNYKVQAVAVEAARAAYDALSAEAKKNVSAETLKKLTDAEADVQFYVEIDDAKIKLNALTSTSSSSQVQAALAAYNKLSDKQKEYITKADVEKFNELAEKYSLSGITGSDEMPELEPPVITLTDESGAVTETAGTAEFDSKTGILTITPAEGYLVKEVLVNGVSRGAVTTLKDLTKDDKVTVVFAKAEGETEAEKQARIIEGVQNTKISIWSSTMGAQSRGKGWIRIWYRKSAGYKVDYYEVWRSKGDKKHFGTSAFYTTRKNGLTGWYRNTKSVKKGVRYYYKVRGVRIIDGQKYYTQWSKTIYRTGI